MYGYIGYIKLPNLWRSGQKRILFFFSSAFTCQPSCLKWHTQKQTILVLNQAEEIENITVKHQKSHPCFKEVAYFSVFRKQCPCLTHLHYISSQALFPAIQRVQYFNWRTRNKHKQRLSKMFNPFRENIKGQSLLHFDCHLDSKLCNQRWFQTDRWPWQLRGMGVGKGINEYSVFCISK